MKPKFFSDQLKFREWLQKNHLKKSELIVGFYKIGSGKSSMTWSQAVDQALCFGWIDGIRRKVDEESYSNRFTPRRRNSNWSDINIKKVEVLSEGGFMTKKGWDAFELRKKSNLSKSGEQIIVVELDTRLEPRFKRNKLAWEYFNRQSASYKKMMTRWIMSAKQTKTRISRLEKLISSSKVSEKMSSR